jgi:hypothetical protein
MNNFLTMKPEGLTPLLWKMVIEYNHEPDMQERLLGFSSGRGRAENLPQKPKVIQTLA